MLLLYKRKIQVMINLLYFMKLADTIGCKHEVLPMPERQANI
jgi:hypothetical protein